MWLSYWHFLYWWHCLFFDSRLLVSPMLFVIAFYTHSKSGPIITITVKYDVFEEVLWCFTSLSTICQLYRGSQFYWWRQSEYMEKSEDLPQVTDKLYYTMLYRVHLVISRIRTPNFKKGWFMKPPISHTFTPRGMRDVDIKGVKMHCTKGVS